WKAFAEELGILGAPFSEELGGLGGGPVENMIVMEEFGKALVVEPYLGTVVIGGGFLKHSGHPGAEALIARIIAGEAIFAFAYAEPQGRYNLADLTTTAAKDGAGYVQNGMKSVVIGAPYATHLIVTARTDRGQRDATGVSVFIVPKDAAGVTTRDYPTVDGFRASEVYLENVKVGAEALVGPEGQALPLVETVVDEAIAATCAEACGVLRKLHEGTLEYTKQRKQFGQPISSFQVLQHRMVDMFIGVEQSISMTYMATIKLGDAGERSKAASAAKVQIGKACKFVGQNAIQLHGGMGMTDEMAIGHYFKRATMIESAFGSTDHHLARYEFLSLGQAA
ncbi:MAG TPA: acyl-CoA dehydrogenase family protein, partial [Phenylobacterium sp.]|nr:acyl-CoA dehydrogenase family protein [Phenylobacterium sp.]